jgi:hypothetical protein
MTPSGCAVDPAMCWVVDRMFPAIAENDRLRQRYRVAPTFEFVSAGAPSEHSRVYLPQYGRTTRALLFPSQSLQIRSPSSMGFR